MVQLGLCSSIVKRARYSAPNLLIGLVIGLVFLAFPSHSHASTYTLSTQPEFESGTITDIDTISSPGDIKIEDGGSWDSTYTQTIPLPYSQGSSVVSDGTYVYYLYANDTYFTRYDPANNTWKKMKNAPHSTSIYKSDMTYLNGDIYVLFGGYQKKFARYDVATNTWDVMTDMPDYILYGASIDTDGTYVYVLRSSNTTDLWRYNPATDTWSTMTAAPATLYTGSDLVYSGGYFYTPRGNNTTTMYRYSVAANTWSTMAVAPATLNGDHDIVTDGTYIYVTRSAATNTHYRYNIGLNTWTTLTALPQVLNYHGFVYVSSVDKYYLFRGSALYDVWVYNPSGDTVTQITDVPIALSNGADLTYYSGALYMVRGTSTGYYRYNISANTWTTLTVSPGNIAAEQKGVVAGAYIYYFTGAATTFYRYDIGANTWSSMAVTPAAVGAGDSLAYPGSGDFIYASRGAGTGVFWRYSISGNSWSDVAVADLPTNMLMSTGSRIMSDGTYIYALTGGAGKSKLYRYDIGGDSWSDMGTLPFTPYWGTDMTYYNGKLYAQSGNYRLDFWEYTVSGGTWRRLENMSGILGNNVGPYAGGSIASNGSGTLYSIWGSGYQRMQTYTVSSNNYVATGTWISPTIDLSYVSSYTTLTGSATTPGTSSVAYETRTSSNGTSWSGWQALSGSNIQSTANRYIQVKATLSASASNAETPTLASIAIGYNGDTTAPTNPSTFTGSSQQVSGSSLVSGNTYSHVHPYFAWSGASDTESTIAGYYVYFGTNSSADPESLGALSTSASYVVTQSLTNGTTYYLRLKTEDSAGNVSSATTGFTYVYNGITTSSASYTSTADFSGTSTNTAVIGDQIKLATDSGGIWEQERISLAPATLNTGSNFAYVASSGKLYTFRGQSTTTFYDYTIATDTWSTLAVAPGTVSYGWIVEGPAGYLYAARAGATASFWRYDIAANTWDDAGAADAPLTLSGGTDGVYDGSRYIYVTRGGGDDAFFVYDTQTDTWTTLSNVQFDILNGVYQPGDLAYDGTNVYAVQGGGLSGFSRYTPSSDTWSLLPPLPQIAQNDGRIEYDATQGAIYYTSGNGRVGFYKYDIAEEEWTQLTDTPGPIGQGSDIQNVNGKLYVMRGASTQIVYTYNTVTQKWLVPTFGMYDGFFRGVSYNTFSYGADIEKGDGNFFYITKGGFDNYFIRYDSDTGAFTRLADSPNGFYQAGDLMYDSENNKIYAITKTSDLGFYQYDIATNVWTEITGDPLPALPGTGATLAFDGSRYIYYNRGGTTTSFYRYDLDASSGARWSTMTVAPATIGTGAELVYKNGNLYLLRGGATTAFYRYNVGANNWTTLTVVPASVSTDGILTDGGDSDSLIACRATNTNTCYKYSLSGNSWTTIDNAPASFNIGAAASSTGSKLFTLAGVGGTNTFADGLYSYVLQTSSTSYQTTGNYASQTHDLTSVYKFANLIVNYTSAASGTTQTPYTRTSADGADWSAWTAAASKKTNGATSEYEIKSPDNRYIQVKFDLTSGDGLYSDVIDDYSVNYYVDAAAPTNPTVLSAFTTATQSASINTNTWYANSAPNFDWPDAEAVGGATDGTGGAGVAGYYVYFGTNASADPLTDGVLQTATAYTAGSLTTGQTYYLRIKTIDDAELVSATTWEAFIYKYDAAAPTNPSNVSSNPPGYSTNSSFTFTWTAGTDTESGVADYCYSTQTAGLTETCTSDRIATASAYTTGANSFYVRTRDIAGNRASTFTNASFYYTGGAPGGPSNLVASPSTNTQNAFTFTWDAPEVDGEEDDIRYYYSVNALPTANNVIEVGRTRVLPSDSYATQKGANYMYIVAQYPSTYTIDEDPGSIDFNNYESVIFTANTSAPGAPEATEIADVSVKSTESWKLALTWNEPTASGSGVDVYKVYRSATTDASCTTDITAFANIASTSEPSYVGSNLEQQTYYYCAKACDSTGNCSAPGDTVSLYPDGRWDSAPAMVASTSAVVKTKTAIISWSTDRTASSFVKYGKSSGDYGDEVGSSDQVTAHQVELKDLEPGTKYYYQDLWTDEDGNTGVSDELTFTTNAAPYVANVEIADVSTNDAYVTASITNATSATLQYGPTTAYGGSVTIPVSASGGIYSSRLENLLEDTEYHVRIVAVDDESNEYVGEDHIFATFPIPKIDESLMKIQQVSGLPTATLRITWLTNTETSTIVTYYPTSNPEQALDKINLTRSLSHQVVMSDLKDETEYTIIVKGRDVAGNETAAVTKKILTAADLRTPEIINMTVESTIVGIGDNAKAQIIVCWDTDEPASTQVEYNQGTGGNYGSATQEDTTLTSNHCVTISGAEAAAIYQIRAVSKDKALNVGRSFDTVIVTPRATKDALNLVIEKLSSTFGFLKRLQKN